MSYVLQNFYPHSRSLTVTPRLKFMLIANNADVLITFFKTWNFLHLSRTANSFELSLFFVFLRYLFSRQLLFWLKRVNLVLMGFYANNLFTGAIYHTYKNLILPFSMLRPYSRIVTLGRGGALLYNLYFLSVKVLHIKVVKRLFRNFFFFLMAFSTFIWYQHTSLFKFYLNFILVNPSLLICPFYNGFFLHIYSI